MRKNLVRAEEGFVKIAPFLFVIPIFLVFLLDFGAAIPGQSCLHPLQAMLNSSCQENVRKIEHKTYALGELKFGISKIQIAMENNRENYNLTLFFYNFPPMNVFFCDYLGLNDNCNNYGGDIQTLDSELMPLQRFSFDLNSYPSFLPKYIYSIKIYFPLGSLPDLDPIKQQTSN